LWFVDPAHLARYTAIIPAWEKAMRQAVAYRHEWDRRVAMWTRRDTIDEARLKEVRQPFEGIELTICPASEHTWNGRNVRPPMMSFGQGPMLGVFGREHGRPKVSFPLSEKPFCGDTGFRTQHLVASASLIGGLYGEEQYTFNPPYIPGLSVFY